MSALFTMIGSLAVFTKHKASVDTAPPLGVTGQWSPDPLRGPVTTQRVGQTERHHDRLQRRGGQVSCVNFFANPEA